MGKKLQVSVFLVSLFFCGCFGFVPLHPSAFKSGVQIYRSPNTQHLLSAGPTTLEPPVKKEKLKDGVEDDIEQASNVKRGGWAVRLFNDPMNKREFVAMCLSKIVGLSDGQSYQVMMQAHQNGVAIVGRYDYERAELYRDKLVDQGLVCDMIPVEED